jgi:ribosomal protein L16 Arg81 hydroxylase
LRTYFGKKGLVFKVEYPDINHPIIVDNIKFYKANKEKVLAYILGENPLSINNDVIIPYDNGETTPK